MAGTFLRGIRHRDRLIDFIATTIFMFSLFDKSQVSIKNIFFCKFCKMLRFLVHLFAAIQFGYSVYYDFNYVNPPSLSSPQCCGKWKYLTFWDAVRSYLICALSVPITINIISCVSL